MEKVTHPVSQWNTGVFDCADDSGSCADAFFCLPCFQTHIVCFRGLEDGKAPDEAEDPCDNNVLGTGAMCVHEFAFLGLPSACEVGRYRSRLTETFNIDPREEHCGACVLHCFCRCCSTAQIYRELKARGIDIGGVCCTAKAGVSRRPPKVSPMGSVSIGFTSQESTFPCPLGYSGDSSSAISRPEGTCEAVSCLPRATRAK